MIWLLLACGEVESECEGPTYEEWAEGFFVSKCLPCHAQDMQETFGAPDIDMTSHEAILDNLSMIQNSILETERMPPGGGISEEERELLIRWFECPQ